VREKLLVGAESLATGDGLLKTRLLNLYLTTLMRLKPEDFDPEQRELFERCLATMTKVRDPLRGAAEASLEGMDDQLAKQMASDFFDLFVRYFQAWFYGQPDAPG